MNRTLLAPAMRSTLDTGSDLYLQNREDMSDLLQVHDELVFELPESDVDAARKVIENVMVSAAEPSVKLDVPLGVDIGTGTSWGAAH